MSDRKDGNKRRPGKQAGGARSKAIVRKSKSKSAEGGAKSTARSGAKSIGARPGGSPKSGWDTVREIALALPGAEEGTSYGTPAFKVRKKLFVRFHQSGESIVINVALEEREALMRLNPQSFYITDHYRCWPYVLVRLSTIDREDLGKLIEESWRRAAPRNLVVAYDGGE